MAEIVKCYRQEVPAVRFVGKCYGNDDRHDGGFGMQWDEWHQNGYFEPLEAALGDPKALYEDGDAPDGLRTRSVRAWQGAARRRGGAGRVWVCRFRRGHLRHLLDARAG